MMKSKVKLFVVCVNKQHNKVFSCWENKQRSKIFESKQDQKYFRFLAEDQDSGRREYLISRNTMLDVTDLTLASVRVSNARVVSITGDILQGHSPGSVEVQVG